MPKVVNESELFTYVPQAAEKGATGAFTFTFLARQNERRFALGGPTGGRKARRYELFMPIYFVSRIREMSDFQDDYDDLVDGLTAYIEADRTAGTSSQDPNSPTYGTGTVFQWGEGNTAGGTDLDIQHTVPTTEAGGQFIVGRCFATVSVLEILNT